MMLKPLLWLPLFIASTPAAALECSDLKPTPPANENIVFTGKVDASVDGLFAKVVPNGTDVEAAYKKVATKVLAEIPDADKRYMWERVLFLDCRALSEAKDVPVGKKVVVVGELYSKYRSPPPTIIPSGVKHPTAESNSPAADWFSGNEASPDKLPPHKTTSLGITDSGYALLYSEGAERSGFGLYTYLLLTPSIPDRSKAMLDAVSTYTASVTAFGDNTSHINAIYIPTKNSSKSEPLKPYLNGVAYATYDFDLSRSLIATICSSTSQEVKSICKTGLTLGPYMFTYVSPLKKNVKLSPPMLFVDLSPIQQGAFATLVDAYKEQIKRDDISDGQKINSLYIKILNVIEIAKVWTDPVEHAVGGVLHLISSQGENDEKPK
jgi:hypothetical protein